MPALPPSGVIDNKPSKTFGSSATGIEYVPVVQPSVLRVDVQSSLPGDTDTFTGITMKAKTKRFRQLFMSSSGETVLTLPTGTGKSTDVFANRRQRNELYVFANRYWIYSLPDVDVMHSCMPDV